MNVHVTALLNKEPDYSMLTDPNLIDLFNNIFIKDPSSRITIRDIKMHSWTTNNNNRPMQRLNSKKIEVTKGDLQSVVSRVIRMNKIVNKLNQQQQRPSISQMQELVV
jgi:hypothetical protein